MIEVEPNQESVLLAAHRVKIFVSHTWTDAAWAEWIAWLEIDEAQLASNLQRTIRSRLKELGKRWRIRSWLSPSIRSLVR